MASGNSRTAKKASTSNGGSKRNGGGAKGGASTKSTTTSKKSSTAKSSSKGRTDARRSSSNTGYESELPKTKGFGDEILILVIVAAAVIMVLSCFGFAGEFGNYLNDFMFGLIGVMEYILPVVLVISAFFVIANKQLAIVRVKVFVTFVFMALLGAFVQKIYGIPDTTQKIGQFYTVASVNHTGGGFIGGLICKLLNPLGSGGTFVILLLLMVICLLFITERSVISGIKKGGTKLRDTVVDDLQVYREYSDESRKRRLQEEELEEEEYRKQEQRRLEREERKARRIEELRKRDEEEAKKPKRRDKHARGVVLNADTPGEPEPRIIAGGDLKELTLRMDKKEAQFDIHDEYSEDIYEPGSLNSVNDVSDHNHDNQYDDAYDEIEFPENDDDFVTSDVDMGNYVNSEKDLPDTSEINYESGSQMTSRNNISPDMQSPSDKKVASGSSSGYDGLGNLDKNTKNADHLSKPTPYKFPPISLLKKGNKNGAGNGANEMEKAKETLQKTLHSFGVNARIIGASRGPAVTRYELQPEQGTKVAKIVSLSDDIKLNMAAADIRIEAPIPGKSAIGIEIPNKEATGVTLRELLESKEYQQNTSPIAFAAGKDIAGNTVTADIAKMPHVLIAGATGSGKSVCINTIIMSILYKARPDEVKLILVDPKVVELSVYNGIPHLSLPVVTDPKKAAATLNWAVNEMTDRYKKFADNGVRDLKGYNARLKETLDDPALYETCKLPQIVIIIDELADLMMVASGEVEEAICRLAQLARAAGIHLVIATQRPSVNVVTGLIKANVPSRIAFAVSSGVDSRTILDMNGAEKLLGKGDMLFYPSGYPKPVRVQGAFVSDEEVANVVRFLKDNTSSQYDEQVISQIDSGVKTESGKDASAGDDRDEYFADAGRFIIQKEKASIGMLQRYYKIGFNRAARIMDQLSDAKLVGPEEGTKPRKILMTAEEFEEYLRK